MSDDERRERKAINDLLKAHTTWGEQVEALREMLPTPTGVTYGDWFYENVKIRTEVIEVAFQLVDVWESIHHPSLPKDSDAEREHLLHAVTTARLRPSIVAELHANIEEARTIRGRLARDLDLTDEALDAERGKCFQLIDDVAAPVLQAVNVLANRVVELNARMHMDALQQAAEKQGFTPQTVETRGDDGSVYLSTTITFDRPHPEDTHDERRPWWRFWQR